MPIPTILPVAIVKMINAVQRMDDIRAATKHVKKNHLIRPPRQDLKLNNPTNSFKLQT
jgi:hypothetical protein